MSKEEPRNFCVGPGCQLCDAFIDEEGLRQIWCKLLFPPIYIGPDDSKEIETTLVNTHCPLPEQRPA